MTTESRRCNASDVYRNMPPKAHDMRLDWLDLCVPSTRRPSVTLPNLVQGVVDK